MSWFRKEAAVDSITKIKVIIYIGLVKESKALLDLVGINVRRPLRLIMRLP